MSTLEEFENAPVGATATHPDGIRVVKREGYETAYLPWICTTYGEWFSNEEMAEGGYTLVTVAQPLPTRDEIAEELSGWPIGSGYYQAKVGIDEARDMADAVLALLKGQEA